MVFPKNPLVYYIYTLFKHIYCKPFAKTKHISCILHMMFKNVENDNTITLTFLKTGFYYSYIKTAGNFALLYIQQT